MVLSYFFVCVQVAVGQHQDSHYAQHEPRWFRGKQELHNLHYLKTFGAFFNGILVHCPNHEKIIRRGGNTVHVVVFLSRYLLL
jgi:hypothetical protein